MRTLIHSTHITPWKVTMKLTSYGPYLRRRSRTSKVECHQLGILSTAPVGQQTPHGKHSQGTTTHPAKNHSEEGELCIKSEMPLTRHFICSSSGASTHHQKSGHGMTIIMAKNSLAFNNGRSTHHQKNSHKMTTRHMAKKYQGHGCSRRYIPGKTAYHAS
jgi:hypothetical protein